MMPSPRGSSSWPHWASRLCAAPSQLWPPCTSRQLSTTPLRWSLSVTIGGFPAPRPCKPWRAASWSEPSAAHSGTAWAGPAPCARSPSCSSSWNALTAPSFSWRRRSPACRRPRAVMIPTCCCSKPASCSAASCVSHRMEERLLLLLEVHQNPAPQKDAKVWYLLRAHVLQLAAVHLSLAPARLSPELRQQVFVQGWKMPETALSEAHKLFCSIPLLLTGSDVLGCQATASDVQFVGYGEPVAHVDQNPTSPPERVELRACFSGRSSSGRLPVLPRRG
ncbi:uncharacterized protein LOC142074647 [Calonectris borealis]|uniref:uncharacterized protein LOC142074647 n=1 Tax=Calonectris borealis TaxID=1323832 RepID=UPI003F4C9653